MSKIQGIFDQFENLDLIPILDISRWLKNPTSVTNLENYVANRILYPQTIATTSLSLEIDLAILREALRRNPKFLNSTSRKILIPKSFTKLVPNLSQLTWAFVDAYLLNHPREELAQDLWKVILTSEDTTEIIGTVLLPIFQSSRGMMEIFLDGKSYKIKKGSLTIVPCSKNQCTIGFKVSEGQLLGRNESAVQVSGGKMGLMIDGR